MKLSNHIWVPKGWGGEKWIVNKKEYCGKLLYFMAGKKCSFHYHKLKDETFYVQNGHIGLFYTRPDSLSWATNMHQDHIEALKKNIAYYPVYLQELHPGQSFYVPPGMAHRIVAMEDSQVFEFSTEHFDDDSYRILKGD